MMVIEQVLQKVESCAVAPLQVVDKQHQRIVLAGQAGQEPAEQIIETVTGFHRRQMRYFRLTADDEFQFRQHIADDTAVAVHDVEYLSPPLLNLGVAFGQKDADQIAQGLNQRTVRDVFLVLVEFAGGEVTAIFDQWFLQFLNQPGFADAGQAGNKYRANFPPMTSLYCCCISRLSA